MNNLISIEKEFDICVKEIGGTKISTIVGSSPSFLNADYIFPQYEVIAELKCLEEDKIKDENLKKKVTVIYQRYLNEGTAPEIPYGTVQISSEGFPDKFKYEIAELYRASIHSTIKKANKQIRETKKSLYKENHHGIFILANSKHTALEPGLAMWIMNDTFQRYSFSSIDSVIYLTANLIAEHPEINRDMFVWIPSHRDPNNRCNEQLLARLRESWIKRLSLLMKEPVYEIQADDVSILDQVKNK